MTLSTDDSDLFDNLYDFGDYGNFIIQGVPVQVGKLQVVIRDGKHG